MNQSPERVREREGVGGERERERRGELDWRRSLKRGSPQHGTALTMRALGPLQAGGHVLADSHPRRASRVERTRGGVGVAHIGKHKVNKWDGKEAGKMRQSKEAGRAAAH